MNALTDQQLLQDYAGTRSEAAFAELVRRHIDLVYSAALRMVCDSHQAEDVTQGVFVALAQNARQLAHHPVLSGWLHRTTQNLAANAVRTNVRRQTREQEAAAMNELLSAGSDVSWEHIAPHLDAALGELSEPDRDAVLLRYFEKKSAREMAERLGISDEAAQKRVSRAVERLREFFAKRGVTVGASGLVLVISTNAVQAAPVGLAVTISTAAALAGIAASTSTVITATKTIAMTTMQKTLITAAVVASVATTLVIQHRAQVSLREQNQVLRQQVAQLQTDNENLSNRLAKTKRLFALQLPAPAMPTAPPPAEPMPEGLQSTNLYERLKDKQGKLTEEQVESYLKASRRNAASLLAAYRTTGDPALLDEAAQKFPNDPQVAFEAVFKQDATPEDRRRWLESFKKSDPENALGFYLSALDYFRSGRTDQAVQELLSTSDKPFLDYTAQRYQDDTEAYLSAGYSVADAKTTAGMQLLLPQLKQLKELGLDMVELSKSYRQAGDDASAQTALQMMINLAERYANPSPGEATVSQLVGLHLEGIALNTMDPASPYGDSGQTVQDRLNQLLRQRTDLEERNRQAETIFPNVSDQDWISYRDRWLMFGENNAVSWLINKYGQQ